MSVKTSKKAKKEAVGKEFPKTLYVQYNGAEDPGDIFFEGKSEVCQFDSEGLIAVYELKEVKRLEIREHLVEVDA